MAVTIYTSDFIFIQLRNYGSTNQLYKTLENKYRRFRFNLLFTN